MANRSLGRQDDVYHAVIEHIRIGRYAPGMKLPSCRDLARDIGSNPNTVHRVLKDLEAEGVVRTEPRKGTFMTGMPSALEHDWLGIEVSHLVVRAMAAGIPGAELVRQVADEVDRVTAPTTTLVLPECNAEDAEEMAAAIAQASGLSLMPVLIDDLESTIETLLAEGQRPVIIVPLFHLGQVRSLHVGDTPILEVAFTPDPESLLQIASLEPGTTVTVASRLLRGVDRLASVVRQYFGGTVIRAVLDDEEADLSDVEVLVHNNASQLSLAERLSARSEIKVSVDLEGRSAANLVDRLAAMLESEPVSAAPEKAGLAPGAPISS